MSRKKDTMEYQFVTDIDAHVHDAFVKQQPLSNLLQSSRWAKVKGNWENARIGVNVDDTLVASASVLIKRLPMGYTMMYIPRGPIMDYENEELVAFFMNHFKRWAKIYKCVFMKMDPCIIKNRYHVNERDDSVLTETKRTMNILKSAGCIHNGYTLSLHDTIQPRFHAMVEACDDFEDTLPKHTKRHIKTARKKHVEVFQYDSEKVAEFSAIMQLTEKRKNISLRGSAYFKLLLDTYKDSSALFLAQIDVEAILKEAQDKVVSAMKDIDKFKEQEDKCTNARQQLSLAQSEVDHLTTCLRDCGTHPYVAACLSVVFGNTSEMLYMGMDDRYKKYMAPYLSHLTPMNWAFSQGCKFANMGGVEGTLDDGLTKFKSNFNPYIYEYVGEFDVVINPLLYKPFIYLYKKRKTAGD